MATITYIVQYDCTYSTGQKKVPVPFPYNSGSTVLTFKKDYAKTFHERYGCVFTIRLYDEAFSSTVYVPFVQCRPCIVHGWIEQAEATLTSYMQKKRRKVRKHRS